MSQRRELAELPVPLGASTARVLQICADKLHTGVRCVLATVVARHGSTPSTPGQKLLLAADGDAFGTVGGGAVEREVLEALSPLLTTREPHHELRTFKLGPELGMCCGGRVEVLLETLEARTSVFLVGGGHVGTALAPLLASLDFAVTLVDMRPDYAEDRTIDGVTVLCGDFDDFGKRADRHGACLTMSHDHGIDQDVIEWAVREGFAFVGGVGSRAKAERTRQRLRHKQFAEADCERIRMPIGLDIGARAPAEIAVAIAAELIAWRAARLFPASHSPRSA